jgi:hypothetical protein
VTSALKESGWSAPHPGHFTPRKDLVLIVQEAGWAPGPVWISTKTLSPTGIRSPVRQACSQSLYRLSYPGPFIWPKDKNKRSWFQLSNRDFLERTDMFSFTIWCLDVLQLCIINYKITQCNNKSKHLIFETLIFWNISFFFTHCHKHTTTQPHNNSGTICSYHQVK